MTYNTRLYNAEKRGIISTISELMEYKYHKVLTGLEDCSQEQLNHLKRLIL